MGQSAVLFGAQIFFLPPSEIIVEREARQRREIGLQGLLESIRKRGIANPLILRRDNRLVAGERRLRCAIELGLTQVPCRLFESMDETEAQIIELEENIKRAGLEWQDECRAMLRIHQLYCTQNSSWLLADTAEQIGVGQSEVSRKISLAKEIEEGNQQVINQPRYSAAR